MFRKPPDPATLDTSSRRSVQIVSKTADYIVVSDFYHDGQFWTARIPFVAPENIFGQSFNFSKVKTRKSGKGREVVFDKRGQPKPRFSFINHLQCRMRFGHGKAVELFAGEVTGEPTHRINDFVYSVEAVGPKGVAFDFKNGLSGTLICAHRFMSTQEMVFERVVVLGYYVWESPPLPLSDDEKMTVLLKSLQRSDEAGLNEVYYLYRCCGTNNCTSNPFRIVDQAVKYKLHHKLGSLVYRLPLNPRLYLRIRGLDSNPGAYNLVRTEFEDYVNAPETQQRKRDVVRALLRERRAAKKEQQAS